MSKALGPSDDLLAVKLDVTQPRRRRGGGAGRGRALRPHRRARQQRRQLLRGLLRGADAGADGPAARDEPHRPDERHARRAAGDAQAALGAHHLDLVVRGPRRRLRVRARPTPRRSSASRAGWSRCAPRSRRSASTPPSSIPGFFRTELLTEQSTNYAEPSIADYDERRAPLVEYWKSQNGKQSGDPAKLAQALLTIASQEPPPRRFIAGADAIGTRSRRSPTCRRTSTSNRRALDVARLRLTFGGRPRAAARGCLHDLDVHSSAFVDSTTRGWGWNLRALNAPVFSSVAPGKRGRRGEVPVNGLDPLSHLFQCVGMAERVGFVPIVPLPSTI